MRRLASLTHFVQWASHTNLCPFPVSERVAWSYLAHLDKTEAAWSKPSGFTQSVNWCRGILDKDVEEDFLASPRVAGICKGFQARAPPPKRAPALSFAEVRFIEVLAASGQNCQDVVCAGAVLFMLFACARASDAARTVSVSIDWSDPTGTTVWIESSIKKSKTAMGVRSRLLLPLLAPCVWFEAPWVENWLEARSYLGLSNSGEIPVGSIVPSFDEAGEPTWQPMAPQNITAWLRAVLAAEFPESRRLSSHSLKATGLSWAASAGVPLETRRLLAHHVHDSARSTETYSRDVLAPAARVFEEVLLAMKNGAFNPDNARGSQFSTKSCSLRLSSKGPAVREDMFKRPRGHPPATAPASGSQWEVVTADPEPVSNTDDSASDRVSEEDLAPDLSLPATRARRSVIAALPYWCVTYMHAMSGCLHVGNSEERLL